MACRWRIRHKLLLGLGLVVAILGLLLAGTFKGLWSYRASMQTVESKLIELKAAGQVWESAKRLAQGGANSTELLDFRTNLDKTREALQGYRERLAETIGQGRALHQGFDESSQVQAMEEQLGGLEKAYARIVEVSGVQVGSKRVRLVDQLKAQLDQLVRTAGDLNGAIYGTLDELHHTSRRDYGVSSAIVLSISVGGLLLLASLFRVFYCWVDRPIRELSQGAGRVAQGRFDQHIVVRSGDELEDLAAAFNHMIDKVGEYCGDLSSQVDERGQQLVRSERLASVGFLAAGVAHEINNPLASIAFCSEALEDRLKYVLSPLAAAAGSLVPEQDRETIARYLKMIQQEAFRCKNITERLLEFSRGGEGQREPADLTDIIHGVLEVTQHLQHGKGKQVLYQPAGPLVAWVNAQEIKSVVLNLVVNALESMDEGGVLTITQRAEGGMAEVCFRDTGCGMAPEVLENIFEPFFTRSRTGKGTGLGLTISHRVLTQHGGTIEASSPGSNEGSTFVIRLPVRPAESARPAPERPVPRPEGLRLVA